MKAILVALAAAPLLAACVQPAPSPPAAPAPLAAASGGKADSAMRAGQGQFDATGPIPCAQAAGQPMGQCQMGVARDGGGTATVAITRPDGRKRFIFFQRGRAAGADISQADGNVRFSATRSGDMTQIRIGNERYEIPDAVPFGG